MVKKRGGAFIPVSVVSVAVASLVGVAVAAHPGEAPAPVETSHEALSEQPGVQVEHGGVPVDDVHTVTARSAGAQSSTRDGSASPEHSGGGNREGSRSATSHQPDNGNRSRSGGAGSGSGTQPATKTPRDNTPPKRRAQSATSGKFVANFVFAHTTPEANTDMVRAMSADAITFGFRLTPTTASKYPAPVRSAVKGKRVFAYSGGIDWKRGLSKHDRVVAGYTLVHAGGAIVVVPTGGDKQGALIDGARATGHNAYLGLPAPRMNGYLPDLSYTPVLREFTRKFVTNYDARGAQGYYHHVEMPVGGRGTWDGVRGLYAMQNREVARVKPGATTIIAPYLETRTSKAHASPEQSARGVKRLLATANGTRLLIAPQDGLGAGTTRLRADSSNGFTSTTEDVFAAMSRVAGARLYATTEVMRPGGGTSDSRTHTDIGRVKQQLNAVKPYTSGSIGFMWNNQTGMRDVSGIRGVTAGSGLR